MQAGSKKPLWFVLLAVSLGILCAKPASSQNLHNMVASQGRVFPNVGAGVIAMREDASGHFYVLANPGNTVVIFDSTGKQIGQLPNSNSGGATIHYAVDFDVAANGSVLVADRAANSIEIFAPDGSVKAKVPVFAPTSVVALSNGQFAVTTLRTEHPVEVIDQAGHVVRGFGESHDDSSAATVGQTNAPPPLAYTGRIVGDSADNLYFAVLSYTDPEVRKFDRFGYKAYAAAVPVPSAAQLTALDDRVQFGFNFMRLSRSDQFSTWTTVGDSGKIQFGSNMGLGLAGLMADGGGRGGRGGGSGAIAGTVTADTSLTQPEFDVHVGAKATQRAGGRGGPATGGSQQGSGSGQSAGNNATLQFANGNFSSSSDFSSSNPDGSPSSDSASADAPAPVNTLQYQTPTSTNDTASTIPGTLDYMTGPPQLGVAAGPGIGGFSSFFLGGFGPRPGGFGHPSLDGAHIPGADFGGPLGAADAAHPLTGGAGLGAGTGTMRPDYGGRGRYGASDLSFVGSMRIILDRPHPVETGQKTLTAIGVDRQTQEIWAAIGPMLVHFDKYGNSMDTYYLTTPEGALLQTTAIVVEPNRLFVGSNAGGVYEFARPDKTAATHAPQAAAPPEKNTAQ
jgi:hypothetical protein